MPKCTCQYELARQYLPEKALIHNKKCKFMQDTFLNQTCTCPDCGGTGSVQIPDDEAGVDKETTVACKNCNGSGAVIDSEIANIVKKHIPEISRIVIPRLMTEIINHIEFKLKDSYDRGVRDGKDAANQGE